MLPGGAGAAWRGRGPVPRTVPGRLVQGEREWGQEGTSAPVLPVPGPPGCRQRTPVLSPGAVVGDKMAGCRPGKSMSDVPTTGKAPDWCWRAPGLLFLSSSFFPHPARVLPLPKPTYTRPLPPLHPGGCEAFPQETEPTGCTTTADPSRMPRLETGHPVPTPGRAPACSIEETPPIALPPRLQTRTGDRFPLPTSPPRRDPLSRTLFPPAPCCLRTPRREPGVCRT
mmetsp:Transcript_5580/g.12929  ORF Transcript_5580/g.12929 Transcript_5580/m.12929 type:complete len:226 (-) Transcript_5580:450-1127(-)